MSPRHSHARRPLSPRSTSAALTACIALTLVVACSDDDSATAPTTARQYGAAQALGAGQVRSYVLKNDGKPTEIGVAFSESAMDNLPAVDPAAHAGHGAVSHETAHAMATELILELPASHGTPYKLLEVNWNPAGHEPAGIYDAPHFDFHFYTITKAERDAIVPTSASFVTEARNAPDAQFARAFFVNPSVALGAPAEAMAVPRMGIHWMDTKSPELQGMVGNPTGYRPFTATYIQGAWNGKFIFEEPMITRAHLVAKRTATVDSIRDQVIQIAAAAKVQPAGYYPGAYRITYDAAAKEYRVALTQLSYRE